MMLEWSNGELLVKAAFMHHDDQWHTALKHYATSKGLIKNGLHRAINDTSKNLLHTMSTMINASQGKP